MKTEIIAIAGATASGKSALAIELARRLGGEIISCDSMQIYRGMNIGTAKPTAEELRLAPHHMIDIANPDEAFSAGDFCTAASRLISDITAGGKVPLICGGTFLYLDSLISSYTASETEKDEKLRGELESYAEENGNEALHRLLEEIDPQSAASIHPNNVKRVIRAIEIYRTSGKTKSEWDALSKGAKSPYKAYKVVIDYANRETLYERINRRVDKMFEEGLEEEARRLYDAGYLTEQTTAGQAIGYKEFIEYFRGEATLGETAEKIKKSSRNYAKRQLTWLRRYGDAVRICPDEEGAALSTSELADIAIEKLSQLGCGLIKQAKKD